MKKQTSYAVAFVLLANTFVLLDHAVAQSIWAVGNTEKINPTAFIQKSNHIWSGTGKQVSIKAAKNEHEPFQLVITADSHALSNINVTVSDLSGPLGNISTDNISLYREVYINVTQKSQYDMHPVLGSTGLIPDALVPFKDPYGSAATPGAPFDISLGENQPIWIDVYIPSGVQAGLFTGNIIISEGGVTIDTISLAVEVWNFEIPVQRHLKCIYEFLSDFESIYFYTYGINEISDVVMENQYKALSDRRLGALDIHMRPVYDDLTGFVWTDVEPLYNRLINQYHFAVLNMPRIYYDARFEEDGDVWWDLQYAIKASNGKPFLSADFTQGSDFMTKAAQYYQRLYDDFSAKGWSDNHYAMLDDETEYVSDEPFNNGQEGYQRVRQWSDILHNANSNIRFLVADESIIPTASVDDIKGYVDIWDMYMDEIQQNTQVYQDHLAANPEEELWMVPNGYADFIDYPAIYHRILGWFAYKYGVTGVELWSVYAWLDGDEEYYDPWKLTSSPANSFGFGGGSLFYPGRNIENRGIHIQGPVTSIRMELNREAMEDYEYLYLLAQTGSQYGKSMADKIIPSKLFNGLSTQPGDFYTARETIGSILSSGVFVRTGTISGVVQDDQSAAIPQAVVTADGAAGITDMNGAYSITVMPGTYDVNVYARGYSSNTQSITIVSNETRTDVNFTLTPAPLETEMLFNSFENSDDLWNDGEGVIITRSSSHATDGSYSMKVTFDGTNEEPYVGIESETPGNWTDYTHLELDIYNDSPFRSMLDLAIYNSNWATLFERTVSLSPEVWNHEKISMDITYGDVLAWEIYVDNYGLGDRDIYIDNVQLIKEETVTSVLDEAGIPVGYSLYQNYPNPFNPSTTIRYQIPESGVVQIKLYDITGREIKTVENEFKNARAYTIILNSSDLASGIYFYRLTCGKFTDSKKIVVLK